MTETSAPATGITKADLANTTTVTPPDTIKGWNDKRKANNQAISSLVPFVQLIGLFDVDEYKKMFKSLTDTRVPVGYDDGTAGSESYNEKYQIDPEAFNHIEEAIKERFINIYTIKSIQGGLDSKKVNGIMMAESSTQMQDPSGGVGLTDLQVDYGGNDILGTRVFKVRMSINDTKILDERWEYSKLATFGSKFLIIYGWANPEIIPGYSAAMPPPKLENDPNDPNHKRMRVPIRNLGNGGYWSSGIVNISKYDFGFNEMGKLELNIELRDDDSLGMVSTVMSNVARKLKMLLDTDILDQIITDMSGNEFTMRDMLIERQQRLNDEYIKSHEKDKDGKYTGTPQSYEEFTAKWQEAIEEFSGDGAVVSVTGIKSSVGDILEGIPAGQEYFTEADIMEANEAVRKPQKGYPEANSIKSHKQIFKRIPDPNPEDIGNETGDFTDAFADEQGQPSDGTPTKLIKTYESQPVYYFLGAIMDSVSICMANRCGPQGLDNSKAPSFYYHSLGDESKLSTAFQTKVSSVNRKHGMEERIQEAVIRLKERFLPPAAFDQEATRGVLNLQKLMAEKVRYLGISRATKLLDKDPSSSFVSGAVAVYAGKQSSATDKIIRAIFTPPPNVGNMIGAPMRGHVREINTRNYVDVLRSKGLAPYPDNNGKLWVYIPDWKQEINLDTEGNEVVSGGSPDGFDPLNPTEYKAQDRGGRFWMIVTYNQDDKVFKMPVSYDNWRLSSKDNWNLLCKKWHNLYREYLASYFENLIRERVAEVLMAGMPIEMIYNEALDLDFLTGKIYNNTRFEQRQSFLKSWDEIGNKYVEEFDQGTAETKRNQEITKYREIIQENRVKIYGPTAGEAEDDEDTEAPVTVDFYAEAEALSEDPDLLDALVEARRGFMSAVNLPTLPAPTVPTVQPWPSTPSESPGLLSLSQRLISQINTLKLQLERLTGGRYKRNPEGAIDTKDIMGNTIMTKFNNFKRIVASQTEFKSEQGEMARDPETGRWTATYLQIYNPEIEYEYEIAGPEIKEEWILWEKFNVPTNNFQNQWDHELRAWKDNSNKAESWKQRNRQKYERSVLPLLEHTKKEVANKLNTIKIKQKELNTAYESYRGCELAIENAENKIIEIEKTFNEFKEFFNENAGQVQLSIYDDTSAFDGDGVKVDQGRDKPAHLTTKVAQQWYRRFAGIVTYGAIDVRNYGPPAGGQEYYLPSNNYQFRFNIERRTWSTMGQPRRVLNPEIFKDGRDDEELMMRTADRLLHNLNYGVAKDDDASAVFSKNMSYEDVEVGRITRKEYQNWSLFGNPGIPYENGNNAWGFKAGPPIETQSQGGHVELSGGNYVGTYKEFLNIFGLGYNPAWPGSLRIVDRWPSVKMTQGHHQTAGNLDMRNLMSNGLNIPIYTMIDEGGNIIVDDGEGWYTPTGWYLDFAGKPAYLYPSRTTAARVNNTNDYEGGVAPAGVIDYPFEGGGNGDRMATKGEKGHENEAASWDHSHRRHNTGRNPTGLQRVADGIADWAKTQVEMVAALFSGDFKGYVKANLKQLKLVSPTTPHGQFAHKYLRPLFLKKIKGDVPVDYKGQIGMWGGRIGAGEHNVNLTLDMKRSMVHRRSSTTEETRFLGQDVANRGAPNVKINWALLVKNGEYYVFKNNPNRYAEYDRYETIGAGTTRPAKGARVIGPTYDGSAKYTNPQYPFGTGWYRAPEDKHHGPYVYPERKKNWSNWSDFLSGLGAENGFGFFTQIDNRNHSPCMVEGGSITDGLEINEGFVKFVIENVFAPLPKNRRTAARPNHQPIKILGSRESQTVQHFHEAERVEDTTYGDLFGPLQDDSEDDSPAGSALAPASFGNMDQFSIDNVANIPIRADVVKNLLSKSNSNMSIAQFFGEIFRPGSMGVNNVPNPSLVAREAESGVFEILSLAGQDWEQHAKNYEHLFIDSLSIDQEKIRFPDDIIMLDFKDIDSLIESMDMNSSFDPLTVMAFEDAAAEYTGSTDALMNFLAYKDVAPELKAYLMSSHPELKEYGHDIEKGIIINDGSAEPDKKGEVTLNKQLFMDESGEKTRPEIRTAVSKFLQNDPGRLAQMREIEAIAAASKLAGSNEDIPINTVTQFMANHMKRVTITIHGTTNITAFQSVIVKGVMPDLEGLYLINKVRESITPHGFQTILEGTLVRNPTISARESAGSQWPEATDHSAQQAPDLTPKTVEEAAEVGPERPFPASRYNKKGYIP